MDNWLYCCVFTLLVTHTWANNTTDIRECEYDEDCATDRVCSLWRCVDPCAGVCNGPHTVCDVTNHLMSCSCSPGYTGNPVIIGCLTIDLVSPDAPGHSGCRGHEQCPASKSCILGKCNDPCEGLCGNNSICTVFQHVPECACKEGHTGNPFLGCTPQVLSETWPPIPHGNKRFILENSKTANWHGAFMSCLRNGSRLASIDSMEELEAIRHLIRQTGQRLGQFWTSGSDYGYEGNYVWASTGKQLSSTSDLWLRDPRQPDNLRNNEHCVEVWERFQHQGYGLNDRPCRDSINYICEYYS